MELLRLWVINFMGSGEIDKERVLPLQPFVVRQLTCRVLYGSREGPWGAGGGSGDLPPDPQEAVDRRSGAPWGAGGGGALSPGFLHFMP